MGGVIRDVGMDSSNTIDVGFFSNRMSSTNLVGEWMGDSSVGIGE